MTTPLISIIIPSRNNKRTIKRCLQSCLDQTYPHVETILVDNHSTDGTKKIAESLGVKIVTCGPERHKQRPAGAKEAQGDWLIFIDSDMYLSPMLVEDCVQQIQTDPQLKAFILPEISVGQKFWMRCKTLERKFYLHYPPMEGNRAFCRKLYESVGGWDPELISGEDFDLHERIEQEGVKTGRCHEFIEHDEGEIQLWPYLKKKYYYGVFLKEYIKKAKARRSGDRHRNIFFLRTCLYTKPQEIIRHPLLYVGMFTLLTLTQIAYGLGMLFGKKAD